MESNAERMSFQSIELFVKMNRFIRHLPCVAKDLKLILETFHELLKVDAMHESSNLLNVAL